MDTAPRFDAPGAAAQARERGRCEELLDELDWARHGEDRHLRTLRALEEESRVEQDAVARLASQLSSARDENAALAARAEAAEEQNARLRERARELDRVYAGGWWKLRRVAYAPLRAVRRLLRALPGGR